MKILSCMGVMLALLFVDGASAQTNAPTISAPVEQTFQRLLAAPAVKSAIEADDERTLREQMWQSGERG